mmetsp:Transcript_11614/g.21573  ORF Transcript_11614/g.21573 Transcript_11614/m.21573 type:complete len:111 (-) Transcript_11614:115-447(-)
MCWRGGRTCDIRTGDGAATDETVCEVQELARLEQRPTTTCTRTSGYRPAPAPECFCRRGINEGKVFPITDTKATTPGNYSTVTAACSSSRSAPAASAKSAWQLSAAGGAA